MICPVFRVDHRESLTARGKMHLLSLPFAGEPSSHFRDIFSRCLLCGACEQVCSRHLPITELITRARGHFPLLYGNHGVQKVLARKSLRSPGLLHSLVRAGISLKRIGALPARSGLRLKLGLIEEPCSGRRNSLSDKHQENAADLLYFTGCLSRYLQPSIARATLRLAGTAGYSLSIPASQGCCGLAASAAGREEEARDLAWQNIRAFTGSRGTILTSCSSCSSHLATYPELFKDDPEKLQQARDFVGRVVEFSSFFLNQSALVFIARKNFKVFYHDPCHLRFTAGGRDNPRRLIERVKNIERVESADGPQCCGQGGLFQIGYPDISRKIFLHCADSALSSAPDIVVTTCSGCLMQWQQGQVEHNFPVQIRHLAALLADCLE